MCTKHTLTSGWGRVQAGRGNQTGARRCAVPPRRSGEGAHADHSTRVTAVPLTSVSTEFLGWAGVGDAELVASSSELIASTSELFASPSELISSTSELLAPPSELIASPSELFAGVAVEAGVSVNSARARGAR
jgi:hypothetical protein